MQILIFGLIFDKYWQFFIKTDHNQRIMFVYTTLCDITSDIFLNCFNCEKNYPVWEVNFAFVILIVEFFDIAAGDGGRREKLRITG